VQCFLSCRTKAPANTAFKSRKVDTAFVLHLFAQRLFRATLPDRNNVSKCCSEFFSEYVCHVVTSQNEKAGGCDPTGQWFGLYIRTTLTPASRLKGACVRGVNLDD
jgi:hypothetical protein